MNYYLNDYLLIVLLIVAVLFDTTQKKIPNLLTLPVILLGLCLHIYMGGALNVLPGFYGLICGIAVFMIPFALGGMGGGDVKLMGAIGALQGVEFILYTAFFTALAGGVMALLYLLLSGRLVQTLRKTSLMVAAAFFKMLYFRLRNPYFNHLSVHYASRQEETHQQSKQTTLPYGVAIAAGAFLALGNVGALLLPGLFPLF